ncbi:hypothetical protein K503DRAFT_371902 [Rhizopogon vinicolor AM-OR11-026]|uniref:DUF6533 domain-containing protein n=1 Tax=Rhizopogon vinicolor AM-OR11-026 TaxID=1314800 RepID=A0A1B7MS11_9AGAM|nr:hypothetical protein K503DRAFT_371902 [Rhizopogon vinicolor AM-OR11-026]
MIIISDDPSWWPIINSQFLFSYSIVACCSIVMYDWALKFGQEVDLFWRHRWSLMTFLYLSMRYIGILFSINIMLEYLPAVSLTDMVSNIVSQVQTWVGVVLNFMLCVIMINRLHVMYQRSRKILIFLIVTSLTLTIAIGVITAIFSSRSSAEEAIASGFHLCGDYGYDSLLLSVTWMLATVWELLALCLAAWIALKNFRERKRRPTELIVADYFTLLIKSHLCYFVGFVVVSCFNLSFALSPKLSNSSIFGGFVQIAFFLQMFVLGPHLILIVRQHHAKLVALSTDT